MDMKRKENGHDDGKKKGMERKRARHAPHEELNEDHFGAQGSAQQHGRVLVITESMSIADMMVFSNPSNVKCVTLHDARRWIEQSKVSKLLIIGDADYYSVAVHDIGHCRAADGIGMVFLQTDGTKMDRHHLRENTVCLSFPPDAEKISEAIGMKVSIKSLDENIPVSKMTQKVLIVTDSKEIAASLERAFKYLSKIESEVCTHSEFSGKSDIGRYKSVIVIESGERRSFSRDILASRRAMGAKNKGIYLSFSRDEKPRDGEICMPIPFNLMELIKAVESK